MLRSACRCSVRRRGTQRIKQQQFSQQTQFSQQPPLQRAQANSPSSPSANLSSPSITSKPNELNATDVVDTVLRKIQRNHIDSAVHFLLNNLRHSNGWTPPSPSSSPS